MVFCGEKIGVNMFATHQIQWFTDSAAAEAVEKEEIKKFATEDAERERIRLARLGLKEVARTYRVSLPETQPGRRPSRRLH